MPSVYTLDDRVVEVLNSLRHSIETKTLWLSVDYDDFFHTCANLVAFVDKLYCKQTGESLDEASRRIYNDTFRDSLELYINYYNVILLVRNFEYKIRWHQKYGNFP